jgi:S-formylglutathione hydrolase
VDPTGDERIILSPPMALRLPMTHRFSRIGVLLALLLFGSRTAGQVAAPAVAGRLVESTVASAALERNLLGDPAESQVIVYLPPGYDTAPSRRYPTLYLLHGYTGRPQAFTRGYQGIQLETMMDDLIRRGITREMILVVPSGRNAYHGSFYTNSPVTGGWEDFISKELVSWVDSNYRTMRRPESRGIAGHSMGGYGSIMMAMKHPDVFSAFYALSPCCVGLEADLGPDNRAWLKTAQLRSRDQVKPTVQSLEEFYTIAFLALSAAFSPNPQNPPLYVDLPFVERNRRLESNGEAYSKWRSQMPLYLVEQYRTNLEKLRGIFLDYGALEEFSHVRTTTRAFSQELASRGIGHTFEVYAGGDHVNKIRERLEMRVLRFFSEVLSFQ